VSCSQKPPTITKVDPTTASSEGGMEITIIGTGFKAEPVPMVVVGGSPATNVKVISKSTLKAIIPAGVGGPASIVIQTAKSKVHSLPFNGFSYYEEIATTISGEGDIKITLYLDSIGNLIICNNENRDLNNIKITEHSIVPMIIGGVSFGPQSVVRSITQKNIKALSKIKITKNELEKNDFVCNRMFMTKIYLECNEGKWKSDVI